MSPSKQNPSPSGTLYVVATPIGNLGDISFRAVTTLREVDFIVCEDTRKSGILLKKYDIHSPQILSFHAHSSQNKIDKIISILQSGKSGALISDAGTPGISDPGFRLILLAKENKIKTSPIPGASAFLAALSASSFPSNRFSFYGFLPQKKGKNKVLKEIADLDKTAIFYESPNRIVRTLEKALEFFPDREICVAREISKVYEEFIYGRASELLEKFQEKAPKGEIVVLVCPPCKP